MRRHIFVLALWALCAIALSDASRSHKQQFVTPTVEYLLPFNFHVLDCN
jgi:hypothetical protein